jgi:hypothetical protein
LKEVDKVRASSRKIKALTEAIVKASTEMVV